MFIDVLISLAAAVVAIVGTVKEYSINLKIGLVATAVVVLILSVAKAQSDNDEKTYLKAEIASLVYPTPSAIDSIFKDAKRTFLPKYQDVDYYQNQSGMIFYLKDEHGNNELVFDKYDMGNMYLNYISKVGNISYIREWFQKKFIFDEFDEDTYNRICVIAELDLGRSIVECLRDQKEGITVIYNSQGQEFQFVLQTTEIKQIAEKNTKSEKIFGSLDEEILKKIRSADKPK